MGLVAHYCFGPWIIGPFRKKGIWAISEGFGIRIVGPWLGYVIILITVVCIFIQCEIFGLVAEQLLFSADRGVSSHYVNGSKAPMPTNYLICRLLFVMH